MGFKFKLIWIELTKIWSQMLQICVSCQGITNFKVILDFIII